MIKLDNNDNNDDKIGDLSVPVNEEGWLHTNLYLGQSLFPLMYIYIYIYIYIFTIEIRFQTAYVAEVCIACHAQFPLL
jgi:hypothetical protein